jgi:hypothetical protein
VRRFGTGDWDSDMKNNIDRREFLVGMAALAGGVAVADVLPEGLARADKPQSFTELTAIAAVTAMRKELKAEDYARALLDRAHQLEDLNAFRTLDREMVLEAPRAADQARTSGVAVGSLHGLPIPAKDSVNSKTLSTSYGSISRPQTAREGGSERCRSRHACAHSGTMSCRCAELDANGRGSGPGARPSSVQGNARSRASATGAELLTPERHRLAKRHRWCR